MFYYLFDYLAWRNWWYAVPPEVKELETKNEEAVVIFYKEDKTQTDDQTPKVEIVPIEQPVNIAELETQQEEKETRRKPRRR